MNNETLYLIIVPGKRAWQSPRIARISKRKPTVQIGQALVRLNIAIPDNALRPPVISVEIKPEHIAQPEMKVTSQQP